MVDGETCRWETRPYLKDSFVFRRCFLLTLLIVHLLTSREDSEIQIYAFMDADRFQKAEVHGDDASSSLSAEASQARQQGLCSKHMIQEPRCFLTQDLETGF